MTEVTIRPIQADELAQLQHIARQTFSETFSESNSAGDLKKYLDNRFTTEKLSGELADKNSLFWFAVFNNQIVGYLKVNFGPAQTEIGAANAMEIERIYVLKAFHGSRVGQQLFVKALEIARQASVDFIWLGVWEHNHRAIGFYRKNGFTEFDKHIFVLGDKRQTDLMMRLELKKQE